MKAETASLASKALLMSLALTTVINADTVDARCDIYPRGEDKASASLLCHFSQRQGYVYIAREDGVNHELAPAGNAPGNYVDEAGNAAYKKSGLGKEGLIFRMAKESLYVYWDAPSLEPLQTQDENPTAPYTTADYDATTTLPCSQGQPTYDLGCPAGILRGDHGTATILTTAPDGTQRRIKFLDGKVATPSEGDLTWRKQGDNWFIKIDNREFYVIPEAAVIGG